MSLLFETIRIQDGRPMHCGWHESRMNRSRSEFWPGCGPLALLPLLVIPEKFESGTIKANVYYNREIESISFSEYNRKPVRSLKLVEATGIDYHVKYLDRTMLDNLLINRGLCDEILIVSGGLVTDTSLSNVIFFDGEGWFTPAKPLLKGTCRERLLAGGLLTEADISTVDLSRFIGCKLINAMRWPEEEELIPVTAIQS